MQKLELTQVWDKKFPKSENTPAQRMEKRKAIATQRTEDYRSGTYKRAGASHVDLYDDVAGVVPYDKMEAFFNENLK